MLGAKSRKRKEASRIRLKHLSHKSRSLAAKHFLAKVLWLGNIRSRSYEHGTESSSKGFIHRRCQRGRHRRHNEKSDCHSSDLSCSLLNSPTDKWHRFFEVPYRLLNLFHQIQPRLVRELEKRFSGKDVVIVGVRRILSVPKVGYTRARPRSRTLTSV